MKLGLPVNLDESLGGDDAAKAVQVAHDEFWKEWRLVGGRGGGLYQGLLCLLVVGAWFGSAGGC